MASESELQQFWTDHAEWSQKTFGPDNVRGPAGPLNHLAKEVQEALAKPSDPSEYADLLLLTFDAARRSGLSFDGLIGVARGKLEVNKLRKWGNPNDDGSVEHVRDELRCLITKSVCGSDDWMAEPGCSCVSCLQAK